MGGLHGWQINKRVKLQIFVLNVLNEALLYEWLQWGQGRSGIAGDNGLFSEYLPAFGLFPEHQAEYYFFRTCTQIHGSVTTTKPIPF